MESDEARSAEVGAATDGWAGAVAGQAFFVVGGAGFIGSHFVDALLGRPDVRGVTIFDNFSSGRRWHFEHHLDDARFRVEEGEVRDGARLGACMDGHDVVIHLASNPDIARAVTEPDIDFYEGTYLTQQVVEAMRVTSAKHLLYASGSGVYGDVGELEAQEDHGPLLPISTYGASKAAGESLIASYSFMFDLVGRAFRFGNVVGPRQTHGVGFDFVRRLLDDPTRLRILGDGSQSKSYIHVRDVVSAVLTAHARERAAYQVYNVATGDYITVKEIADLAFECLDITPQASAYEFTGGDRGWKGDVPIVRLSTERIRALGWAPSVGSRGALGESMLAMLPDARAGRL
ncbi:MAG: NAD-dependent epimerase/dehydratase family protein [Actinobacteria bacterium]|nr:NAD-dependent epimerase/dehydratase family protein [Actinomycetota bacterium]